jgi:putative membrane protein
MKKNNNTMTRLTRVAKIGAAALSATILATSALQAQTTLPPNNAPAADTDTSKVSHKAKEFLKEAGQANQTEIAMSNVAESKSQNSAVKDLARMMRNDHQQNYAQLQTIALARGVTLEAAPDFMNQREINRLQKANDADFDKEYTKVMLKDHVKCIKRFDKAATEIEEQDVKQYAQSTLPALRRHLQHSENAARAAGLDESTISTILKDLPTEDRAVSAR